MGFHENAGGGGGGSGINSAGARITTDEAVSGVTYSDPATPGPAVTITTGTTAILMFSCVTYRNDSSDDTSTAWMSVAVSGATTIAASDSTASSYHTSKKFPTFHASGSLVRYVYLTGLTAGSNTFTCKYRTDANPINVLNRAITVIA